MWLSMNPGGSAELFPDLKVSKLPTSLGNPAWPIGRGHPPCVFFPGRSVIVLTRRMSPSSIFSFMLVHEGNARFLLSPAMDRVNVDRAPRPGVFGQRMEPWMSQAGVQIFGYLRRDRRGQYLAIGGDHRDIRLRFLQNIDGLRRPDFLRLKQGLIPTQRAFTFTGEAFNSNPLPAELIREAGSRPWQRQILQRQGGEASKAGTAKSDVPHEKNPS